MEPTSGPAEPTALAAAVGPAPAELARTIVDCGSQARLRIAWSPGLSDVPYVPDENGEVWLLLPDDRSAGWPERDLTGVVHIDDGPAGATALVGGRLTRVAPDTQQHVVLALAELRPLGALLDVGRGVTLHHLAVQEVRLTGSLTTTVELAGYATARPDPVRPHAAGLLGHLAREHRAHLAAILRAHLGAARGWVPAEVAPVTLDRYGLELIYRECHGESLRRVRVAFQAPIRGIEAVGAALRAITPCECRAALDY